eukprot:762461-Hanusia_phi.AAC.1
MPLQLRRSRRYTSKQLASPLPAIRMEEKYQQRSQRESRPPPQWLHPPQALTRAKSGPRRARAWLSARWSRNGLTSWSPCSTPRRSRYFPACCSHVKVTFAVQMNRLKKESS